MKIENYNHYTRMQVTYGLCAGRHDMPVDKCIFEDALDPTNFSKMTAIAAQELKQYRGRNVHLVVYATGLTAAMITVVKVCSAWRIDLTVMHYNRETGSYLPQTVIERPYCVYCGAEYPLNAQECPECQAT